MRLHSLAIHSLAIATIKLILSMQRVVMWTYKGIFSVLTAKEFSGDDGVGKEGLSALLVMDDDRMKESVTQHGCCHSNSISSCGDKGPRYQPVDNFTSCA